MAQYSDYSKKRDKVSYALLRIVTRFSMLMNDRARLRNYGTDVVISEAEIHTLQAIKECEDIHVIGLAERMSVTKGAVSQIVAKLHQKGLIVKNPHPDNQSRLILRLTEKGEIAYQEHEKVHRLLDWRLESLLQNATKEEYAFLMSFLKDVDGMLSEWTP